MDERAANRDQTGRFLPGTKAGPGRPPVPEWLKGETDGLLRLCLQAVKTGRIPLAAPYDGDDAELDGEGNEIVPDKSQVVPAKTRIAAAEMLIDRVLGRPIAASEVNIGDEIPHALLALLELAAKKRAT